MEFDDYEPHEAPTMWAAVGTNRDSAKATWFYTFVSFAQAEEFKKLADNFEGSIEWDIYPCGTESAAIQFDHFKAAYEED